MVPSTRPSKSRSQPKQKPQANGWKGGKQGKLAPVFTSIRSVLEFASKEFAGHVVILKSALESADDSTYVNKEEVLRVVQLLAAVKIKLETDRLEGHKSGPLDKLIEASGVSVRYVPRISTPTKNKYGKHYLVKYGTKFVSIVHHFTLGSSRDPRHCLSLHFHIDKTKKGWLPVIGHCGRHLPTVST